MINVIWLDAFTRDQWVTKENVQAWVAEQHHSQNETTARFLALDKDYLFLYSTEIKTKDEI